MRTYGVLPAEGCRACRLATTGSGRHPAGTRGSAGLPRAPERALVAPQEGVSREVRVIEESCDRIADGADGDGKLVVVVAGGE